ncbi:hypothetical protein FQA47_010991 [Oryzias melastigma]|uniref:Uncharacterized protein n=1 Tax=Oryzias melastigma TaxID=30732 RepID=A0A834C6R0_ORYME|nr:hypothetical protein FQA47_010991 [Oryzias melastigma]
MFRLLFFTFVQQIQDGRRSGEPHRRMKQPPSCLLPQTGLRCHGNMLWRSTYWDSAGWRSRGFPRPHMHADLDEGNLHPSGLTFVFNLTSVFLQTKKKKKHFFIRTVSSKMRVDFKEFDSLLAVF